jgi:HAD domain in Swiss Army Knife RNA repair proteins
MDKVIFLDMDGPMIPAGMYFIDPKCSFDRKCSPISVAIINRLCLESGAKIVTNTYHNTAGAALKADLIREGIKEEYFHENWQTIFPHGIRVVDTTLNDRMAGIQQWMIENGEVDWLCFDDSYFTKDERLILVDFDAGIGGKEFDKACRFWNLKPFLIL